MSPNQTGDLAIRFGFGIEPVDDSVFEGPGEEEVRWRPHPEPETHGEGVHTEPDQGGPAHRGVALLPEEAQIEDQDRHQPGENPGEPLISMAPSFRTLVPHSPRVRLCDRKMAALRRNRRTRATPPGPSNAHR